MARVIGLHQVKLRRIPHADDSGQSWLLRLWRNTVQRPPTVTPEEFEHFVLKTYLPTVKAHLHELKGMDMHLLKCNRGDEAGNFIFMFEFDSVETRDRYFPDFNTPGPELLPLLNGLQPVAKVWDAMSDRIKNDYVVLDEVVDEIV